VTAFCRRQKCLAVQGAHSTTDHLIQISRNATGEFGYDWMPINPAGRPLILATPRCVSVSLKIVVNCETPVSVSVSETQQLGREIGPYMGIMCSIQSSRYQGSPWISASSTNCPASRNFLAKAGE